MCVQSSRAQGEFQCVFSVCSVCAVAGPFQELRRELAGSKEEAKMYLNEYNTLLGQVVGYKEDKEKALQKLERYSQ